MLFKKSSNVKKNFPITNEKLITSINAFKKKLDKNFFATTSIKYSTNIQGLVINVHCNYNLSEIVTYLSNGTWGNIFENQTPTPFVKAFNELEKQNIPYAIDIEEFNIHFNDTTVVINRIYKKSIPDQLENILTQLANHYIYYTKGHTEMPYEIYIPIFEENLFTNKLTTLNTENTKEGYYKFWCLYFSYMEDEATIYDLEKHVDLNNAPLFMVNS